MKLNIFSVPSRNAQAIKDKFGSVGLKSIHEGELAGWRALFFFSDEEQPNPIPWVATFADFFDEEMPANLIYFAAYVLEKGDRCFVLTYGKSHFYVRPFCDHDFGIEMAKRIANDGNTRQTSSKRFAGNRKKEIRSYTQNTSLNVESGESVDYLQAEITPNARKAFGSAAKFGSSMLLNAPVEKDKLGHLLDQIEQVLSEKARFTLPRTVVLTDETDVKKYDRMLLQAIAAPEGKAEFTSEGHDIVGVDFVFSGNERYTLSCRGHGGRELGDEELSLNTLRTYMQEEGISERQVFDIRVRVDNEGQKSYSKQLKQALDFIVDGENVMLTQGRWVRFNEDYIDQLNAYVDSVVIEETEPQFRQLSDMEGDFNKSEEIGALGYSDADKDFSKIKTSASTPIEAWDLHKNDTVYAVKFGTAQKVGYVCDQALNALEIIRNNANLKKLDQEVRAYCLWLGLKRKRQVSKISEINSIILKQKIEAWARKCRELDIVPKLKLSLHQSDSGTASRSE